MTKISARYVRALQRDLLRNKAVQRERIHVEMNIKNKKNREYALRCTISTLKKKNEVLKTNVRKLHRMFLKQQQVIRQQRCDLLENGKRNPATTPSNLDCAKTMIAMKHQVCPECLGAQTICKTKKNIRYSVKCKACKF
tara:strand:+ start:535 stop:951 length:417 start_codon:yes stop_codon:yes gene_type:complete